MPVATNRTDRAAPGIAPVFGVKLLLASCLLAALPAMQAFAQKPGGGLSDLTEVPIDNVQFTGNVRFTSEELADAISSRPSDPSVTRRAFEFYTENFRQNPYSPPPLVRRLQGVVSTIPDGLRYFSDETALDDAGVIEELYNQHGYHEAKAAYGFARDSSTGEHTLTFTIAEGKPFRVRALEYRGLGDLPPDVAGLVRREMAFAVGETFNEPKILREANAIEDVLKNNGWYFSSFLADKPKVYNDIQDKSDSVVIKFIPGKRIKVGSIAVERQLNGQGVITDDLVRAVSDLREGEWYSRKKVTATINALYQLGVYDFVSIDTTGRQVLPDSVTERYNIRIYTRYKEQLEVNASVFLNRTANDNLTNFGVESLLTHRNAFGAAQNFNAFVRYIWNDFQFSLPGGFSSVSTEIQGGLSLIQPILESWDDSRISGSAQALFSQKFVIPQVSVNTFSLKISTPIIFPPWAYFSSFMPEVSAEWQSVGNGAAIPASDPGVIQRGVVEPLKILNSFTGDVFRLTGFVFSGNLISDSRNDLFTPGSGHLLTLNPEAALGPLARYQKGQITYLHFFPVAARGVFALKFRVGHIFADSGDYIPVERLFFAGGANSVRSYGARLLFDPFVTKRLPDSAIRADNIGILTGSKSLLEGSFEYRLTFGRPSSVNSFIASQIERMGITFFLDYGTTYNSGTQSPTLGEMTENIAVGFGLGFRYSTPVGPFRVDVATKLYDPTSPESAFISQRNPLDDLQLHIGLGHSF